MPAIRDISFAYESTTTDAGLTIPICNVQQNDLLLVFAMADTGAGTWGCSGYTQLFARNNTCSVICYWKIAGASEGDVVLTNTVSETYNGCVIAIRDVNTTYPFGNAAVYNDATQAAASRFAMQQITTTVPDSLVLYFSGSSAATVPSFTENKIIGLLGADGAAESMGLGWLFQRATGQTPADIYCANAGTTGAGVKAVIQIAAPSGGATVIPPYCVSDPSVMVEMLHGVAAYNGNTAIAATADTNFGTSLGGKTANDAVVAAIADVGINSFHGMAGMTNAASAGQISGAEIVLASGNRFNLGTKNLLCHVRASTPAHMQRHAPVSSGRGVWFGVRSNTGSGGATTGYKIWQVHGVGTPWAHGAHVPIIINNGAGNTKATSGTLDAAVIAAIGFWTSAIGALTAQMGFGTLWLMDTTVIAGGNSSEPLGVPGIVAVVATGKERQSAIVQGSNQLLCLQMIQFGDGGTNSIYLDLSEAAVEFPRQYNAATAQVNYNSVDDKVGFIFYPGASDTIKPPKITSSPSRFYFGLHASASASAAYDFSGKSVIGAASIVLNKAITVAGFTIDDYLTLDLSNATFAGGTIKGVPAANDSLATNASTNIDNSDINVSTVTAGNRWCSVADPSIFSGDNFTGGGGHAIRITTPGTYSFVGNVFTGFGADGSTGAAIFNDSGGAVILNISGGGSTPTYKNGTSASTTVNNNVDVTLTGLKNPSEVRVFNAGTQTERSGTGAENVTTGTHVFSIPQSTAVDIVILSLGYQNMRILNYSTASNATIPVSQVLDRQYNNP